MKKYVRLTLNNVQNKSWILVGMEVYHVANGSICERWTEHRDVIL